MCAVSVFLHWSKYTKFSTVVTCRSASSVQLKLDNLLSCRCNKHTLTPSVLCRSFFIHKNSKYLFRNLGLIKITVPLQIKIGLCGIAQKIEFLIIWKNEWKLQTSRSQFPLIIFNVKYDPGLFKIKSQKPYDREITAPLY